MGGGMNAETVVSPPPVFAGPISPDARAQAVEQLGGALPSPSAVPVQSVGPSPEKLAEFANALESALGALNATVVADHYPEWVLEQNEIQTLAQGWAPLAALYAPAIEGPWGQALAATAIVFVGKAAKVKRARAQAVAEDNGAS